MARYTQIAIIYNPNSTGPSRRLAHKLQLELKQLMPNQKVDLIATEHQGHAEQLAYELAQASKHPLVIISSGDGGYHEVINGLMRARAKGAAPVAGLLPAGNANDHYHNLHRPNLAEAIRDGHERQIDLLKLSAKVDGRAYQRYAHSYIGFGLTAAVAQQLNRHQLNRRKEVWLTFKTLLPLHATRLQINSKTRKYDSLIISNVNRMSKFFRIAKNSRVDDGKFEVTIYRRRNRLRLALSLLKLSTLGYIADIQTDRFKLQTINSTLVQLDGEVITLDADSQANVTVEAISLNCIV